MNLGLGKRMSNRVNWLGVHTNPPAGSSLIRPRSMYQMPSFICNLVSGMPITAMPLPLKR